MISVPVGPIGVLCIQCTLADGRIVGLVSGLGAATADATYAAVAALWWFLLTGGVSLVRDRFTPRMMRWVNLGSGAIIALFGVTAVVISFAV